MLELQMGGELALFGIAFSLLIYVFVYRQRLVKLQKKLKANLEMDLELATSEQLMQELRKRPPTYLLLRPENNTQEGCFGISVEIHNIEAVPAAGILKVAAMLAEKELKRNGVKLPDFPDFPDEVTE